MSKRTFVIALGILVALMPFLGFPGGAKTIFFVIAGLAIAMSAYIPDRSYENSNDGEDNTRSAGKTELTEHSSVASNDEEKIFHKETTTVDNNT